MCGCIMPRVSHPGHETASPTISSVSVHLKRNPSSHLHPETLSTCLDIIATLHFRQSRLFPVRIWSEFGAEILVPRVSILVLHCTCRGKVDVMVSAVHTSFSVPSVDGIFRFVNICTSQISQDPLRLPSTCYFGSAKCSQ